MVEMKGEGGRGGGLVLWDEEMYLFCLFFFFVSGETEQLKDGKLFPVVYFVCVLITWWFRLEIGDWRQQHKPFDRQEFSCS
jgi:phosphate starvation-inducible membrane PsiE